METSLQTVGLLGNFPEGGLLLLKVGFSYLKI